MVDSLTHIRSFAEKPLAFLCGPYRTREAASTERCVIPIGHTLRPPADRDALQEIKEMLGQFADPFLRFYQQHDGLQLYKDPGSDLSGVDVLPVSMWKEATHEKNLWLASMTDEDDPAQVRGGVAFAYVPETANGFVISLEGDYAGQIFYVKHDDSYMPAFAANFDEFLIKLTADPINLLNDVFGGVFSCHDQDGRGWTPQSIASTATPPSESV